MFLELNSPHVPYRIKIIPTIIFKCCSLAIGILVLIIDISIAEVPRKNIVTKPADSPKSINSLLL
jgi:hypothetical protein